MCHVRSFVTLSGLPVQSRRWRSVTGGVHPRPRAPMPSGMPWPLPSTSRLFVDKASGEAGPPTEQSSGLSIRGYSCPGQHFRQAGRGAAATIAVRKALTLRLP
jgi:hypothetical protein